jgi:hypothetical protein
MRRSRQPRRFDGKSANYWVKQAYRRIREATCILGNVWNDVRAMGYKVPASLEEALKYSDLAEHELRKLAQ